MRRRMFLFAALVIAQIAHSFEEYVERLWEVLPPAQFISRLFSSDLSRGFLVFNLCVTGLGLLCLVAVARGWPSAGPVAWSWGLGELGNGVGHLLLAVAQRGYFPGLVAAPALIACAIVLMHDLRRASRESS